MEPDCPVVSAFSEKTEQQRIFSMEIDGDEALNRLVRLEGPSGADQKVVDLGIIERRHIGRRDVFGKKRA